MADVTHEPVRKAMGRIVQLSADEEAQRLAFVRERGLRDWNSSIGSARREGLQQGLEQGLQQGLEQGLQHGLEQGLQQGLEEGLQRGRVQALRDMLSRLLAHRFGDLPDWAVERLTSAQYQQLEAWLEQLLAAESLDTLLQES